MGLWDSLPMTDEPSRPSGTVTFLFTDIEGSTRLWEGHPAEMQGALVRHDEILRSAIEGRDGYVFSTAGDAFAAAFGRAGDAVSAAVDAQLAMGAEVWPEATPVRARMGLHTGEAQERDGDYFGPALNRAARIMSAGHGGQILVGSLTASLVPGVELMDLGEHRLKDLANAERLFQVRGDGLVSEFKPLRTVDDAAGNLPIQSSSLVGRSTEVGELLDLVRTYRLVTLTGVGGVGKTRLAIQVAAELTREFVDGVWLVELAPVSDPAAVPAAVAAGLGVSSQSDQSVTDSIATALSGRDMLIVLDNCEHVLDAAAELIETTLARAEGVKVIATSREGLRVEAERLWAVPPLDTRAGPDSAAVQLFVERARAVNPGFTLGDDTDAIIEICQRLDGIALAIELAAARMVTMTPADVRDRLDDRFRILSGSRRGMDRHQTLRHAVEWSYDLLDEDERMLLNRCSVFADGFDPAAASYVAGDDLDEYAVLDLLDSLVRKSLVTTDRVNGHIRFGLLETIRQFAEDQLVTAEMLEPVRRRHASYFADRTTSNFNVWDGPDQRTALDWFDVELANLRVAFQWSADSGDLIAASAIAAHAAILGWQLQSWEPVSWAEEILDAATAADVPQLPRLYTSASLCLFAGRANAAVGYIQTAKALKAENGYDPFNAGWTATFEGLAHAFDGRIERWLEISAELAAKPEFIHAGLCALTWTLPVAGRDDEARAMADDTLAAARAHGNPFWEAWALAGHGRSFTTTDPARALEAARETTDFARDHRLPFMEALIVRETAALEATHGQLEQGLAMFDATVDSLHRAGAISHLMIALANMVVFFDRFGQAEIAATLLGVTSRHDNVANMAIDLQAATDRARSMLGTAQFDQHVATGAAMDAGAAVRYARHQIRQKQHEI
jgi:predicted ATPase/class 3 adenylate cyclase